ncbi:MAG: type IV pilus twitching motility protein PilT [Planctomycetes bacterium]|nr:type IV pilus twitching motility protein PilT [Planctomycetota bacterium]
MVSLEELLMLLVQRNGSDLHIAAGAPPKIRIDGRLINTDFPAFTPDETQKLLYSILDGEQIARFEAQKELDLSFGIEGLGRFRTNVFLQRGALGSVLRVIPHQVKGFEELGLPRKLCEHLCSWPRGLILVTGATGSGKSTTLAAMIDYINTTEYGHIVTVEDPIEFVHANKNCLVNQREVGSDTLEFKNALRAALRQDPDVVLIGEMRDLTTIEAALTISETGHLTFGTLHTSDAIQTINRIVDVFPAHQQQQIRTQLSFTVQAVFCQQLLPRANGKGRVLSSEILIANAAVRALIRDNKAHQVYSHIQTGGKEGMRTMNQSLYDLYKGGQITYDDAIAHSGDVEDLKRTFQKGSPGPGSGAAPGRPYP